MEFVLREARKLYLPYAQSPTSIIHILMRTQGDPLHIAAALRREISAIDPQEPVFDIKRLEDGLAEATGLTSLLSNLLSAFAGIALVLAALGIYGVTSCWMSQRTREIGIRMALGATTGQVLRLIAAQSAPAVLGGALAGLISAPSSPPVFSARSCSG